MKFRHLGFLAVVLLLVQGCERHTYDEDDFDRYERMAESDPDAAIDHLRRFIYNNPEHFDAHMTLARLFKEKGEDDDRKMYLARHYLSDASDLTVPQKKRDQASQLYTRVRVSQGVDLQNAANVLELAGELKDQGHYGQASELYIGASWIHARNDDLGDALDALADAKNALEKIGEDARSESEVELLQKSRFIKGTILQMQGDFSESGEFLFGEQFSRGFVEPFPVPQRGFLLVTKQLAAHLEKHSDTGSWGWGSDSIGDDSSAEARFKNIFEILVQYDEEIERFDDPRTKLVVGRIWRSLARVMKDEAIAEQQEFAQRRAGFYKQQAGELVDMPTELE